MDFVIAAMAGVGAGFLSNPFDVIKTRMQLQGELKASSEHQRHYKNIPHAIYMIIKHDGILAVQRGLVPALWAQVIVNGTRYIYYMVYSRYSTLWLGIYETANGRGLLKDENNKVKLLNSCVVSTCAGLIGGLLGTPFHMVKTHLMAQSTSEIAVGTQHSHKGFTNAIIEISRRDGIKSMFRGARSMMLRTTCASPSQVVTYEWTKEMLETHDYFPMHMNFAVASLVAGCVRSVIMTPADVILTRICNQAVDKDGKGVLYEGIVDCFTKIKNTEGLLAFYKGFGPSATRQVAHSIFLLVLWDTLKDLKVKYYDTKT